MDQLVLCRLSSYRHLMMYTVSRMNLLLKGDKVNMQLWINIWVSAVMIFIRCTCILPVTLRIRFDESVMLVTVLAF